MHVFFRYRRVIISVSRRILTARVTTASRRSDDLIRTSDVSVTKPDTARVYTPTTNYLTSNRRGRRVLESSGNAGIKNNNDKRDKTWLVPGGTREV